SEIELREVTERLGNLRGFDLGGRPADAERASQRRFCANVVALRELNDADEVQRHADVGVRRTETPLAHVERRAGRGERLVELVLLPQGERLLLQGIAILDRLRHGLRILLTAEAGQRDDDHQPRPSQLHATTSRPGGSTTQTRTGPNPFRVVSSPADTGRSPGSSDAVSSETRIAPAGAAASSRCARFTAAPTAVYESRSDEPRSPTIAGPVWMPIRMSSGRCPAPLIIRASCCM